MMIDFGQPRSNNEQEITALFLTYLPIEPLPGDLASRLKAHVLREVKNSLIHQSFIITPPVISQLCLHGKANRNWQVRVGIVVIILALLLMGLLSWGQLLARFL